MKIDQLSSTLARSKHETEAVMCDFFYLCKKEKE